VFAFFDLDQTLIPYDTQALFCQFVLRRHGWRRLYLATWLPALPLAGLRLIGHRGLKSVFLNYLWRLPKTELHTLVQEFVTTVVTPMLYPAVVAKLREHQAAGLTCILNTASPDFYAQEIARSLQFDHCFATRMDLGVGDRVPFTPQVLGPNNKGANKLPPMADLLQACSARPIPGSYAYSDSHADIPMLRLAEFPVMIHPTPRLAAEGLAHGWTTMTPPRPFSSKWQHHLHTLRQITGCG
jgi:HAD superfamily hydrolase (TIGR01490 family)